ncbi:MAG: LysM peptidoglycan-binding domain-containing protein [Chloroflexota bacterium]|nr:LysM peptidoglycan-binding domain-containing protein [Anaerolineae bacterium]HMM29807.1 LysM peptidoglycan-binding domain-containing protein [Aggregatilineaceae bacterium]
MRLRGFVLGMLVLALLSPAWLAQAEPALAQGGGTTHIVQPGENLYRIALRYGTTWPVLAAANGLVNPNLIYSGQRLIIPGAGAPPPATPVPGYPTAAPQPATPVPTGGTYVVQAGDTLSRIALRFNTTVAALVQLNNIVNPNLIYVGQVLRLSGAAVVPPTAVPGAPPPTTAPGFPTAAPPPATTVPQPPPVTGFNLGGHVDSFGYPNLMRQAGMTWAKRQIRYTLGDSPDGAAGAINQAHSQGFRILLGIVGDPAQLGANPSGYMDQFAGYLAGVARLGPDAIEVWNEQNLDREWPRGQINPATYTTMLQKAYTAIKSANPSVMVISGAPAPTGAEGAFGTDRVWNDDRYVRGMAAAGAANYADCIGLHYNEGIVSPDQTSGDPRDNYYTRYFWGMINTYWSAFGGARPLCFTELGYVTPEGYAPLPAGFEWGAGNTVAEQAAWLARAAQLSASSGRVRLMIIWNVDFTSYGADPQAGYAIVRPGGGCPACQALDAVMP